MKKIKKKLSSDWKDRKVHFGSEKTNNQRYCLHAWSLFDCDGHGDTVTHSHDYARTDAGWDKLATKEREYVDAGYTVSVTRTGK